MSKDDFKIMPVDQEMTKEDLKKVKGGIHYVYSLISDPDDCEEEGCAPLT